MAIPLKADTAVTVRIGPFLDETDGITEETGLTITQADVRLSKDHAAFAQKNDATACTHEENGWYQCPLNATDTNTEGPLQLYVGETGAVPVWHEYTVLPALVYDSLIDGTDALQVHVNEMTADIITAAVIANGAIDAATFAAGAIDAAAIATGAIDADAIAADAVTEIRSIVSGTADSGSTTTLVDAARTEADDDYWKGHWLLITSGSTSGQVRLITAFTAASDTITVAPAFTQAISTNTYEILPANGVSVRQWLGTTPNVLVSGRVDSSVGNMAANVLTATAINADAITAAKIAANAIGSSEIANGAITAAKFGAGAIDAAAIANGAIDAATFAAGAIDAAAIANGAIDAATFAAGAIDAAAIATGAIDADAIATDAITAAKIAGGAIGNAEIAADAIDASKIAADVTTEFRSLVSGTADSGSTTTLVDAARTEADNDYWKGSWLLITSGTTANQVRLITAFTAASDTITVEPAFTQAISTNTYEILPANRVDLGQWLGVTPNALVSGAVDADVSAMQAGVVTAAAIATNAVDADALATDGVNEIRDSILSDSTAFAGANIDAAISSRATPAQVNTEVLDVLNTDTFGEPGQEAPAATTTIQNKIAYLYKFMRNRVTVTASTISVFADDATTVDHKSTHSDDATTYDRGEFATGP